MCFLWKVYEGHRKCSGTNVYGKGVCWGPISRNDRIRSDAATKEVAADLPTMPVQVTTLVRPLSHTSSDLYRLGLAQGGYDTTF